ncbi:MAG: hypothetical protein LBK93_03690 [Rickettsiales bacterium]|nr:hypothetical protein [Rickettsiales bacterium]
MLLLINILERSSSPPTPPADPDPSKKDPSSPPTPPEEREREDKPSTTGKYKRVYNTFEGGSVDDVNKRSSCPSH